jgi:prophage antirepressor-like protein
MEIVKKFSHDDFNLNVYGTYEEPLFLAKEVGDILGLGNIRSSLMKIKPKHKVVQRMDTLGGKQDMTFLKEAGLYKLIMRCDKPIASDFQDWVCEEVLPSIRKTGFYQMSNRTHRVNTIFHITDESSLHKKVIEFIKNYYPEALYSTGLGELQDTKEKRIDAYQKGYLSGSPDLTIHNLHKKFTGMVIEMKSPTGKGILSGKQHSIHTEYRINNFKVLVSNSYDEIIIEIIKYMHEVRVQCPHCAGRFRTRKTLANHKRYFHRIMI